MDLHNNLVGRNYFKSVASIKTKKRKLWFKKKWLEAPSDSDLKEAIKAKADASIKVDKSVSSVRSIDINILVRFI